MHAGAKSSLTVTDTARNDVAQSWEDGGDLEDNDDGEDDNEDGNGEFAPIPDDDEDSAERDARSGVSSSLTGALVEIPSDVGGPKVKPSKPRSSMPNWLKADYDDTCERLRIEMKKNLSGKPSCYNAGLFTDAARPPIFASNNVQLTPSAFYKPTYFVWLPHLFGRIPCPSCKIANRRMEKGGHVFLSVHSWPRLPRRVVDIDRNMYIIGHRYYCGNSGCGKTYQSWSQAILDAIPPPLASCFNFHLTHRCGMTDQLVGLLRASFQRGIGPWPFTEMIRNFHVRHYEHLQIQYLEMVKIRATSPTAHLFALHPSFGTWNDCNGYAGFVPTHKYFRSFYDSFIERHAPEIDQHMAMLPARVLVHDHSFKVCFHDVHHLFDSGH